jgi:hypothetical protein
MRAIMDETSGNRVLYDNQMYRTNEDLKRVDRRFIASFVVLIIISSVFVITMDSISALSGSYWLWARVVMDGFVVGLWVLVIAIYVYCHLRGRNVRVTITERGIFKNGSSDVIDFAGIEKVAFHKGYAAIKLKGQPIKHARVVDLHYIWNISKFKEVLEEYTVVENQWSS